MKRASVVDVPKLLLVLLLSGLAVAWALSRLQLDTDIVQSLPRQERTVSDALQLFEHHPVQDQLVVDIGLARPEQARLLEAAELLQAKMVASGLFSQVGLADNAALFMQLSNHVVAQLPSLLSREDLAEQVLPRLLPGWLEERLASYYQQLQGLEGIGQSHFISHDPLALRELVLARMALLSPAEKASFQQGQLFSADGQHIMLVARPQGSGTDTAIAASLAKFFVQASEQLTRHFQPQGVEVKLTPMGAYRAALDNESIIKADVNKALALATIGIGLLLLLSFSRPWLGLLCLVPALAGTATALLVYSFFASSLSIMVLGFGGAVISITVDHGIAYLLFVDGRQVTDSRQAAHEVKAIGLMAMLTSVGAFLLLSLSGFPLFVQLGRFTAMGILFSFVFVHTIFPLLVNVQRQGVQGKRPLTRLVNWLYGRGKPGFVLALTLLPLFLFMASPQFKVSLRSMNCLSPETREAVALINKVWGDTSERIYLMVQAASPEELQQKNDELLSTIGEDQQQGLLASAFVPSLFYPGGQQTAVNSSACQQFWHKERRQLLLERLQQAGEPFGFRSQAFAPFLASVEQAVPAVVPVPAEMYELLTIVSKKDRLFSFATLLPGPAYDASAIAKRYQGLAAFYDGSYFSEQMGDLLFTTFSTMLLYVGLAIALLLTLLYRNFVLVLITLAPVAFAYVATLATLNLLGLPLDIPALMLSIVILGMGVDYAILTVRAHQRYGSFWHPSAGLVRNAVFLAGTSTLIGFGVLALAGHSLLTSIGLCSFLGIGYSMLGAFLLLPTLLTAYLGDSSPVEKPLS